MLRSKASRRRGVRMREYIYIYICISIYVYTYTCIYLSISLSLYIYIYTSLSLYIYIYIYMYTYMYTHILIDLFIACSPETQGQRDRRMAFWTFKGHSEVTIGSGSGIRDPQQFEHLHSARLAWLTWDRKMALKWGAHRPRHYAFRDRNFTNFRDLTTISQTIVSSKTLELQTKPWISTLWQCNSF